MCECGWSFRVMTLQLHSVSAAKQLLSPSLPSSLSSACIDSWMCSSIPMSGQVRRSERRGKRGSEGYRNEGWRDGGQKAHGKAMQEKEQDSNRIHGRRGTTAEQSQEKDKRCAVKCQGYLIH